MLFKIAKNSKTGPKTRSGKKVKEPKRTIIPMNNIRKIKPVIGKDAFVIG